MLAKLLNRFPAKNPIIDLLEEKTTRLSVQLLTRSPEGPTSVVNISGCMQLFLPFVTFHMCFGPCGKQMASINV